MNKNPQLFILLNFFSKKNYGILFKENKKPAESGYNDKKRVILKTTLPFSSPLKMPYGTVNRIFTKNKPYILSTSYALHHKLQYTVKRVNCFPVPAGMSLTKLFLGGNN
jgi:hypothetical protein